MPDNNQNNNNQDTNNQNNQNNTGQPVSQSKSVVLGCDSNNEQDSECQNTVKSILTATGDWAKYKESKKTK